MLVVSFQSVRAAVVCGVVLALLAAAALIAAAPLSRAGQTACGEAARRVALRGPSHRTAFARGLPGQRAQKPGSKKPGGDENKPGGKPDGGGAKKAEGDGEENNGEDAADATSIKRPNEPPRAPDPRELQTELVDGRVRFEFYGQPWPDVLQWLANVSELSLDWQELPADYLNLTTQRGYTPAEARDLINRHLQARGYVLLVSGEVLSVTKISRLDPSLVPRIEEEALYDRPPHDFVKVAFQLPEGMGVKQAAEDVKQALSKHAKLLPLAATGRLLAIDAVANLRLVSALLNEERLELEGREAPKRFQLRYARAERVIDTLYVVLGLDPASRPSQMELQLQQQKMQLLMQMQQRGKDVARLLNKDGPPVYLAFNRHDNSILANAPPEQMRIIERSVAMLDIPAPGAAAPGGADAGQRHAQTYQLASIEPDSLIRSLEEIGNLDPLTDLRGDKKSKVLFARATEGDHRRIEAIIKRLDGPKHRVEVFWLRRHPADEVAGTLAALVAGKEEKKDDSSRRRRYYWYGYDDEEEDEEEESPLRVEADIENNRIFVRGNDAQIADVRAFLAQIGELPDASGSAAAAGRRPVRVLNAIDAESTDRLIRQLRAAWPTVGGAAELKIHDARPNAEPNDDRGGDSDGDGEPDGDASQQTPPPPAPAGRTTRGRSATPFRYAAGAAGGDARPSVAVTVTEDGRLVLSGDDPELLARLEDLVEAFAKQASTFTEYRLQHVAAWYVHTKLEDFYEEILNAGREDHFNVWGEYEGTSRREAGSRLSRRRRLRMVYNSVTNSIVVTNASPAQLEEIKRLIDIWDQPPQPGTVLQRRTGMVKVRYSRAATIAAALKDVYRDLLSKRDREFDTAEEKGSGIAVKKLMQIEYSGAPAADPREAPPTRKTKAVETTFDGALSIGVDELANMLVISADAELYASVVDMVQQLDEQARPTTAVRVVRVGVPAGPLRESLDKALERPWPGGKPERAAAQPASPEGDRNRRNGQPRNRQRRSSR